MNSYSFVLIDVFTDTPLTGNPLAVFPEADGLPDAVMQNVAREFNFSETTFVVSPRDERATRRLRCFSPVAEVFGAGHNALGAWWAIVASGQVSVPQGGTVWQELGDRVLPLQVTFEHGLSRVAMTQPPPQQSNTVPERGDLARALSIDLDALNVPALEPCVVSTGATTHLLVPVRSLEGLACIRVDAERLISVVRPFGCEGCYCYSLETLDKMSSAHARGFFPGIGIAEDPATGSAAGPLGAYLVSHGLARDGEWVTVEQGDEINRRARIDVRVTSQQVDVGGRCVVVGSGIIGLKI
jgi:trans-2,3-dihydro-3-hydroxyanthranilate isomerase